MQESAETENHTTFIPRAPREIHFSDGASDGRIALQFEQYPTQVYLV